MSSDSSFVPWKIKHPAAIDYSRLTLLAVNYQTFNRHRKIIPRLRDRRGDRAILVIESLIVELDNVARLL